MNSQVEKMLLKLDMQRSVERECANASQQMVIEEAIRTAPGEEWLDGFMVCYQMLTRFQNEDIEAICVYIDRRDKVLDAR
jgi:hypothetical protein